MCWIPAGDFGQHTLYRKKQGSRAGICLLPRFRSCHEMENASPIKEGRKHLDVFLPSCEDFPSPAGLGVFIQEILALSQDCMISHTANDPDLTPARKVAWPTLTHITRACLTNDIEGMLQNGEKLIGLCIGLTPSGDDFIGDCCFASKRFRAYRGFSVSFF
jgi:hypothetical protein